MLFRAARVPDFRQRPDRQNRQEHHQALAQDEPGVDRVDRKDGEHGHRPDGDPAAVAPPGEDVKRGQSQQIERRSCMPWRDNSGFNAAIGPRPAIRNADART